MKSILLSLFVFISFQNVFASEFDTQFTTYSFENFPKKVSLKYYGQALDVLFVIDNSGSMSPHQENLSRNIGEFTKKLSEIADIQFGVISTDMEYDKGRLLGDPKIVTSGDTDFREAVGRNIMLGTMGSPLEAPLDAIMATLGQGEDKDYFSGFLRNGAQLLVIMMTDSGGNDRISVANLLLSLQALKGDSFSLSGFIVPPGINDCLRDPDGEPVELVKAIEKSGGLVFNLCSGEMGSDLLKLVDSANNFNRKISLLFKPVVDTLKVFFKDIEIPSGVLRKGWAYDPVENAILLGKDLNLEGISEQNPLIVEFAPSFE